MTFVSRSASGWNAAAADTPWAIERVGITRAFVVACSAAACAAGVTFSWFGSTTTFPDGAACAFYGSAYGELLRCLTAFEGAMLHEQCRSRGEEACVWRTAAAEVYE